MSNTIVDLEPIEALAEDLAQTTEGGVVRWVIGDVGSGRSALLHELQSKHGAVPVWTLDLGYPDAAIHAVMQAAMGIRETAKRKNAVDTPDVAEAARRVANQLAEDGVLLAVRLRPSWSGHFVSAKSEDEDPVSSLVMAQIDAVRASWIKHSKLRLVLVTDRSADPKRLDLETATDRTRPWTRLDRLNLSAAAIQPDKWSTLSGVVEQLSRDVDLSVLGPLSLRLAVAAQFLGVPRIVIERAVSADSESKRARGLVSRIAATIDADARLSRMTRLLLGLRLPLPLEQFNEFDADDKEASDLFCHALAPGNQSLSFPPSLATALRAVVRRPSEKEHAQLLEVSKSLDGQVDPWGGTDLRWWAEKHYQASCAGDLGQQTWEEGEAFFPSPVWFWMRGKALSRGGRYGEAAEVYRRGVRRFQEDSYCWHYLGLNLARAGLKRQEAEDALQKAVALEPTNAWWNSRLVTFYIAQGRFADADSAWAAALEHLDPELERTTTDVWLLLHTHRWVALAWLEAGEPERALQVFAEVPDDLLEQDGRLLGVQQAVADAAEAEDLGESVYPPSVDMAERWSAPRLTKKWNPRRWFPGRIAASSSSGVEVVYAVPDDLPEKRRVLHVSFEAHDWESLSNVPIDKASVDTYVELAVLEDETERIAIDMSEERSTNKTLDARITLSYLRQWAEQAQEP